MIAKVKTLKGTGVFENLCSGIESPKFTRNNLIYGLNGSGKTTLGRVFASLGMGTLHGQLATASFEIELANGVVLKSKESLDALKGRLFVFNVDFVDENLKWREGAANPVFYIGKEQAEFADKLKVVEAELQAGDVNKPKLQQAVQKATKSFSDFKRDTARTIGEQLVLSRRYDASTLATDYQNKTYGVADIIPEEEVAPLLLAITQASPLPKLDVLQATDVRLTQLVKTARRLLSTTVGEMALKELQQHPRMVQWVKDGLEYHAENKIDTCMLCGNVLTEERKDAIKRAIDDRFTKLKQELLATRDMALQIRRNMEGLLAVIPSQNDLSSELRATFVKHDLAIRKALGEGCVAIDVLGKLLGLKIESINTEVKDEGLGSEEWTTKHDITVSDIIAQLNRTLESHNKGFDQFDAEKDKARAKIKSHHLARNQASYKKLESNVAVAVVLRFRV